MVWETWALASGGASSEIYRPKGASPEPWDKLKRDKLQFILDKNLEPEAVQANSLRVVPLFTGLFVPNQPADQKVRMNRATFEFIISNEMYNVDDLEALVTKAAVASNNRFLISFPTAAKEIKAQWLPIDDAQKSIYLWRDGISPDGKKQSYGLVSLHIITKDLPNWVWAGFDHVDCENRQIACNIDGQEAAQTRPVDSTTRGPNESA